MILDCVSFNDNHFYSFLKHQVKGIFDNHFNCIHFSPQSNFYCNYCYECIQEIIINSNYQEYFQHLYKTIRIGNN